VDVPHALLPLLHTGTAFGVAQALLPAEVPSLALGVLHTLTPSNKPSSPAPNHSFSTLGRFQALMVAVDAAEFTFITSGLVSVGLLDCLVARGTLSHANLVLSIESSSLIPPTLFIAGLGFDHRPKLLGLSLLVLSK